MWRGPVGGIPLNFPFIPSPIGQVPGLPNFSTTIFPAIDPRNNALFAAQFPNSLLPRNQNDSLNVPLIDLNDSIIINRLLNAKFPGYQNTN